MKTDQKGEAGNCLFLRGYKAQAILFDLDRVVIDSEPLYDRTIQLTSIHLGRELSEGERGRFKGPPEPAFWKRSGRVNAPDLDSTYSPLKAMA